MSDPITAGRLRSAALDAAAGLTVEPSEPGLDPALVAWAAEQFAGAPLIGLDPTTVPAIWRPALAWAGVPFAPVGILDWATIREDPSATVPVIAADHLVVPPLPIFTTLTSLPLRDLREWVARSTGVRLRLPVGIRLWLAAEQALLVNRTAEEQSGFLHGPQHGMRAGITLAPGEYQVLTW